MATREKMQAWLKELKEQKAHLESELKGVNNAIDDLELVLDCAGPGAPAPKGKETKSLAHFIAEYAERLPHHGAGQEQDQGVHGQER